MTYAPGCHRCSAICPSVWARAPIAANGRLGSARKDTRGDLEDRARYPLDLAGQFDAVSFPLSGSARRPSADVRAEGEGLGGAAENPRRPSVLPMDAFAWSSGKPLRPWTSTWMRHGVAGGSIRQRARWGGSADQRPGGVGAPVPSWSMPARCRRPCRPKRTPISRPRPGGRDRWNATVGIAAAHRSAAGRSLGASPSMSTGTLAQPRAHR